MKTSITAMSSRNWIDKHPLKLQRYLRRFHKREDYPIVFEQLFWQVPDEGKKLIQNFDKSNSQKRRMLIEWLIHQPQITCGVFADQRMGKDALICEIFSDVIHYFKTAELEPPRFVTLGNIKKPPFVDEDDMYFSFRKIPAGSASREVWIYCSEIETVLPAREGSGPENKLFSQLEGTMAQNHQKLFGASKLASKVDINFIRGMNVKLFKFISPEKLRIEGVERENIISPLARWHLPDDKKDKPRTLMVFDNNLLTANFNLPNWWSTEYSEQFRDVSMEKIKEAIETYYDDGQGMKTSAIRTIVQQRFRVELSKQQIEDVLGIEDKKT